MPVLRVLLVLPLNVPVLHAFRPGPILIIPVLKRHGPQRPESQFPGNCVAGCLVRPLFVVAACLHFSHGFVAAALLHTHGRRKSVIPARNYQFCPRKAGFAAKSGLGTRGFRGTPLKARFPRPPRGASGESSKMAPDPRKKRTRDEGRNPAPGAGFRYFSDGAACLHPTERRVFSDRRDGDLLAISALGSRNCVILGTNRGRNVSVSDVNRCKVAHRATVLIVVYRRNEVVWRHMVSQERALARSER